jgi:hypothetical protein
VSAQSPFPQPPAGPAAPAGGGPAPPAQTAWWRRGWGVVLIALVCASVGAGVGVAAASGGGSSPAKTAASAKTVTVTVTSHAPASAVRTRQLPVTHAAITRTVTVTVTLPANERAQTLKTPKTYSGDGRHVIGTLNLPHGAVIHWHASSGHFTLENSPEATDHLALAETGTSGEATTAEGVFPRLEVLSPGHWEFTISPF